MNEIVRERASGSACAAGGILDTADEIVVFGSMAAGLDRPDSDVDVLCFGERESKLKSRYLDLIMLPRESASDPVWLQSELAAHVSRYGVWIKGVPEWLNQVGIGEQAVADKRRRVEAFMRCLPAAWPTLNQRFKRKYAIKVRREAQRLLLMSRGQAVPPTRLLDEDWQDLASSECELGEYLHHLAPGDQRRFSREFFSLLDQNLAGPAEPYGRMAQEKFAASSVLPEPL